MTPVVFLAILVVLVFAFVNGVTGAATATATLVASRAAHPGPAVVLAAVFNLAGPFLFGTAVAATIAALVALAGERLIWVIGAGTTGAVAWTTITWRLAIPSSSSHALVGGLLGAALLEAGPNAIGWGRIGANGSPGVIGILVALAISPLAAAAAAYVLERGGLRLFARMTVRAAGPVRAAQYGTSAWLAASHGANDSAKSAGLIATLLVASGQAGRFDVSPPIILGSAVALTLGTALGGWGIVHTIGRRIYPVKTIDGLVSQGSSAAVIFAASLLGAPVSTNQVVASSVVGIGLARGRWHHVRWQVVRTNLTTWLTTIPAAGLIAAISLPSGGSSDEPPMTRLGWILPADHDVLALLQAQATTTVEGLDALVAWAGGDPAGSDAVREAEHRADVHKRALRVAVRRAFITPIAPEDLFVLSGRLNSVLNEAKDAVREAELLKMAPDAPILAMSERLAEGVRRISSAFDKMAVTARWAMDGGPDDPTVDADAAVKAQRALEWIYRGAMAELLMSEDLREITGRREIYRRFSRMSETVVEVAERIWYAAVKEP